MQTRNTQFTNLDAALIIAISQYLRPKDIGYMLSVNKHFYSFLCINSFWKARFKTESYAQFRDAVARLTDPGVIHHFLMNNVGLDTAVSAQHVTDSYAQDLTDRLNQDLNKHYIMEKTYYEKIINAEMKSMRNHGIFRNQALLSSAKERLANLHHSHELALEAVRNGTHRYQTDFMTMRNYK